MDNTFCIYVFSDQWGVPKYVGKAKDFAKRMDEHLNRDRFRYSSTWFYRWLNKQIANDIEFFMDILEEVTQETWIEREIYWIKHIKDNGYRLTNMTNGGDGNNNQIHTKESRLKRSKRMMGHEVSEETRKRISKGLTGKVISKETRKKLSNLNKGKICLESTKLKFSKVIDQYDLAKNFIQSFTSLTNAAIFLNCRKSSLSNAMKRKINGRFKNYLWKYK